MAADTFVNVLYDDDPLQGVDVVIDGEVVGKTNRLGSAEHNIDAGQHQLQLQRSGATLGDVSFDADSQDDVEISIRFSSEADEPRVTIKAYAPGDLAEGFVGGVVTTQGGEPIYDATVSVADGQYTAKTDRNGAYQIALPRGEYAVEISHPDFEVVDVADVRVPAELGVVVSARMRSAAVETSIGGIEAPTLQAPAQMEEVVIMGTYNPSDSSAGIERFATSVVDALDIGQLERFGDTNVAAALTRLVGVTLADDKFVVVRGLDGRYISSTLNGILMPSTDPLRRDVQLDLFPSDILGGVELQKTFSADLLGTSTGGSVRMTTRGIPDEPVRKVSVSGGYNTEVTGEDYVTYKDSSTDVWGYDSGLRELPSGVLGATNQAQNLTICELSVDANICTPPLEAAALGVKFQDDYNIKSDSGDPDFGASLAYGDRYALANGDFGFYAAADYSHSTKNRADATLSDAVGLEGDYQRSTESYNLSGYLVAGYEYGDANLVESKSIWLRSTDNTVRFQEAVNNQEGIQEDRFILQWVEREFISQQFTGSNLFNIGEGHTLDWRMGYSQTNRYEPDRRGYSYINGFLSTTSLERRWADLAEDSIDVSVDYSIPFTLSDSISTIVKVGGLYSDKSREWEMYRFGLGLGDNGDQVSLMRDDNLEEIFSYQNFALDVVRLATITTNTDSYNSDEEMEAVYLSTETLIGDSWTVVLGLRQEEFSQEITYPNAAGSNNFLDSSELLPALSINYNVTEELQIRAGFSSTVSYPGIIERSESVIFDPETDKPIFGNPDLVSSTIDNFDMRFEYYFNDQENVTLALFYKDITDPVERAVPDASGSGTDGITFRNSESATLQGVEIDAYKTLFENADSLWFLSGNLTFIESEVTLGVSNLRLEGENQQGRDLQGQAPRLANLQLGFDHFATEQKLTLLVNYADDKIFQVSRGAAFDPIVYNSRTLVDLNYEKLIGESLTVKAKVKNLLNEPVEWSRGGRVIESFEDGISFSLSASYEF
ncbi:TonB-dependent receptor [Halioxenophilus aromaticivorans]|uniref:TonB-dependent receptor n=2 Tax=Halioxenophilus aromaticivorans TaxID=1306992 RepID=A0AAV3U5E8_9ALTE